MMNFDEFLIDHEDSQLNFNKLKEVNQQENQEKDFLKDIMELEQTRLRLPSFF